MLFRLLMVCAIVTLTGCASSPMLVANTQHLPEPTPDQAQVVFMRSSLLGSAINASLYRVDRGQIEFIGIMANGTKIVHRVPPGKHVFMVVSEAADFMEADLAAGKTYHSLVTPRMGAWKARFSLWPIKADAGAEYSTASSDFAGWLKNTRLVENTPQSRAWYDANKNSVYMKYTEYWPVWQGKSAEDLARRTLVPEDGL
ncbi:MAG: DUF2846 domain-containing protein [Pseudazoarcus pumilus]|nr:DUF2846 domain-containing protein [Pseudazoarcus pumilus]